MAKENYSTVPNIEPLARPPEDYFHIQADPAQFGGLIAQGAHQLGQGISHAADEWGQVQTDYQLNNAFRDAEARTNKFLELRQQDALYQKDTIKQELDQIGQQYRSKLSGAQQTRFDREWRPYLDRYLYGKVTTHLDTEGKSFQNEVNKSGLARANLLGASTDDEENLNMALDQAGDFAVKNEQAKGNHDPVSQAIAVQQAKASVYASRIEAVGVRDPERAYKMTQEFGPEKLGSHYHTLASHYQGVAETLTNERRSVVGDDILELSRTNPEAARAKLRENWNDLGHWAPIIERRLNGRTSEADPHRGAYNYFIERGWSPAQAAGIVGGLRGETANLNPTQTHDGGIGIGIAGWNGERRAELNRFAASNGLNPHDRATQLAFVDHELRNNESAAGALLRTARTPEEAGRAMLAYERPHNWNIPGAHPERSRYARQFYDQFGGQ